MVSDQNKARGLVLRARLAPWLPASFIQFALSRIRLNLNRAARLQHTSSSALIFPYLRSYIHITEANYVLCTNVVS